MWQVAVPALRSVDGGRCLAEIVRRVRRLRATGELFMMRRARHLLAIC